MSGPSWLPDSFYARAHAQLGEPVWVEGAVVVPSASLGLVFASPETGSQDVDELLARCDEAMYRSKKAARARRDEAQVAQDPRSEAATDEA